MTGPRLYVGIDPGVSGGIAAVDDDGDVYAVTKTPETEADVLACLEGLAQASLSDRGTAQISAVIERVWSSPQMGVASAFTFGRCYGVLRTALCAAAIPFDEITPGVWQKAMGIRQKTGKTTLGETHTKDKNIAKRRAQELFPRVTVTHHIADALLIAEYARRRQLLPIMAAAEPPARS